MIPNNGKMGVGAEPLTLSAALGSYGHTTALKSGQVRSTSLRLEFADISPINRAFAPTVREGRFDLCEMAIATFLQAKAYGKGLVLLPVTMVAQFQEGALLCRADGPIHSPADLTGKRIGVRAYSQTTGMWLRGIFADDYGVRPEGVRWVTFEDAHVAEYRDPPWAKRASPGQEMLSMLRAGELDAVIVGNDLPDDPALRTVFPHPAEAAEAFWRKHRFVPVNHLVTVRRELAESHPDLVAELLRLFRDAKAASPSAIGGRDPVPMGRAALQPAIDLALRYSAEQGLLPRPLDAETVWEGLPAAAKVTTPEATSKPIEDVRQ